MAMYSPYYNPSHAKHLPATIYMCGVYLILRECKQIHQDTNITVFWTIQGMRAGDAGTHAEPLVFLLSLQKIRVLLFILLLLLHSDYVKLQYYQHLYLYTVYQY